MKKSGVYTCQHCGGLKESLETEKEISEEVFLALIKAGIYEFYAYDHRIDADRYLICNIPDNLGLPTWINDYEKRGLMRK